MDLSEIRLEYHHKICSEIIRINENKRKQEYPNFADGSSKASIEFAWGIIRRLGYTKTPGKLKEQTAGGRFERITKDFLEEAFGALQHLRPGNWIYSTKLTAISGYAQYEHLAYLKEIVKNDKVLHSAIGSDYVVTPDIIISRQPVSDNELLINKDPGIAQYTYLRKNNYPNARPILHASISCKWTIRSDRSQNTRTEALNLIRNRKGHLPHIVAVTAEPLPTRIASLALGTGDLDCVYHFALNELKDSIMEVGNDDQLDMLNMMVEGRRLRDISDLPFDLAV